jgi:hypothetical protein
MHYLLDYLSKEMQGEKRSLGLQLLRDPIECDPSELQRWIPPDLCEQLGIVQSQCRKELQTDRGRLIKFGMGGIAARMNAVEEDGAELALGWLARVHIDQICAQAREDLLRKGFAEPSSAARSALILLYAFSEALFSLLFGLVGYREGEFIPTEEEAVAKGLELYLFGHQLASDSHLADALSHATLLKTAAQSGNSLAGMFRENGPSIRFLVHNAMDKFLSCNVMYDALLQRTATMASHLRDRCRLICYLYLRASERFGQVMESEEYDPWRVDVTTQITDDELRAAGFSQGEVNALVEMSSARPYDERLLVRLTGGTYSVGTMNLKYALNAYSADFFASNAAYGDWFENNYVRKYLQKRLHGNRYVVLGGFKAKKADPVKYDVDAMIFDRRLGRLYFLQIKHRGRTMLPFLRDELREFSLGKWFSTALRQLQAVRECMDCPRLIDRVKSSMSAAGLNGRHVDTTFLRRHSGCLVIHSVENFDFGATEGTGLYEWNTFRNLLHGEMSMYMNGTVEEVRMDLGDARLDDPPQVAEAYMQWEEAQLRPADHFYLRRKLALKRRTYCELLTTRRIEILGRWHLHYPFLRLRLPVI